MRLILIEPCEHGNDLPHGDAIDPECPGGRIIDPSDPHRIEAAARAIGEVTGIEWEMFMVEASAAIAAFLDPEDKDTP